MLLNLSNHPSEKWGQQQKDAAIIQFGGVLDMPFPLIDPIATLEEVQILAEEMLEMIHAKQLPALSVHVMGEFTFCYSLLKLLEQEGIGAYASTTKREVVVDEAGVKTSVFLFIKFRPYY